MPWLKNFQRGTVIPAHPLALTRERKLDEKRQRALTRYYLAAGAGGVAVGVHTTQFAIREPRYNLLRPVLEIAAGELRRSRAIRIAGVCGPTPQAVSEAEIAAGLGYHAALVSLGALRRSPIKTLLEHLRAVGEVMPVVGFYLQPAVGGRILPYEFWRQAADIPQLIGIKIAPFNRYQTLDVVRAVAASGRAAEIALYTGNDDNIVADLLTPFRFPGGTVRIAGGLLGHWAFWTKSAVALLERIHRVASGQEPLTPELLTLGAQITDANAAVFDAANGFRGCIPGIHEVLRRQGLLEGLWCLDEEEKLSPGQLDNIDRVYNDYSALNDDAFVLAHRDAWLR